MRAPHPSLRRLFGLAAVPAQHGAAWQALDARWARLDAPAPGGPADAPATQAALLARLDTLLNGNATGRSLAPLLDRLLGSRSGADNGPPDDRQSSADAGARAGAWPAQTEAFAGVLATQNETAAPLRRPGMAAGRPSNAARLSEAAQPAQQPAQAAQTRAAAPARRTPALPWPTRPASLPLPAARNAAAAAPPTASATAPLARLTALARGPNKAPAPAAAGRRRAGLLLRPDKGLASAPWPDAAAAAQHWQQRLGQAGLGAPWQATMQAPAPARHLAGSGSQPAWPGTAGDAQAPLSALPGPAPSHAPLPDATGSAAQALSQRLASALRPLSPPARPAATVPDNALPARTAPAQPPLPPLQPLGARVGGFRGLAALGLPAAAPLAPTPPPPHSLPASAGPAPDAPWPAASTPVDPQTLIDQIEAALREQAVRNGISLGGLEPH